ncbi:MptD family putative ECF transporter S component [Micromonospora craniellae]|uniref:Trep_Strep domain-containing protein n=1 Tax=Micromonospora craniellae TaxID=2294034 RepID=A0A372FY98_9ACTN|nr:MptD family putative ECF transporter S component [Micromonospora craniellae]RFS45594.1 Trep_Strep domain-containing protein [Micromonospora craniellae]
MTSTSTPAEAPVVPERPRFSLQMSALDLVNIGIFAALYIVVTYAIAMLGVISPLVALLTLPLAIIAGGIPYMLFLTRVKHAGMVTIFGVLVGGLMFLTGHPWISFVITVVVSLLAEAILLAGRYRSQWHAITAFAVFSLWYIGPMLPILTNPDEYYSSASMQAMGDKYVDDMRELFTTQVLAAYCVAVVVAGVLGGLLGAALLRKHFRRAGLA